jgi:hypothetical protein
MSQTIAIRKSEDDKLWLRQQEQTTARSQGQILKDVFRQARQQRAGGNPLMRFCGDLALKDTKASRKEGFSR